MSVNAIAWAPHDFGLVLAVASSDGFISILTWKRALAFAILSLALPVIAHVLAVFMTVASCS